MLDELEHHAVECALPEHVARREALHPGRLAAFILRADAELKLLYRLYDKEIILGYAVELRDNLASFGFAPSPKEVATARGLASAVMGWQRATYGDSGRKKIPERRIRPQSIWSPTGILHDAEPSMWWVPRSIM